MPNAPAAHWAINTPAATPTVSTNPTTAAILAARLIGCAAFIAPATPVPAARGASRASFTASAVSIAPDTTPSVESVVSITSAAVSLPLINLPTVSPNETTEMERPAAPNLDDRSPCAPNASLNSPNLPFKTFPIEASRCWLVAVVREPNSSARFSASSPANVSKTLPTTSLPISSGKEFSSSGSLPAGSFSSATSRLAPYSMPMANA